MAVLVFGLSLLSCASATTWQFNDDERVIAISDVHGDYNAMLATLRSAGVISDDGEWAAGAGHLVITGDLLDRGPDSRKVMDLVMRLEPLALEAGGQVHLLLGNHEVMNLVGDLRYVAEEEYAAFADDEDPAERERWFQHYFSAQPPLTDEASAREAWNAERPPGFFGHRRAFRSDGHYGQWLKEKPLIVVINGTAFVHGGLSPEVAELGLQGVNGRLKAELVEYVEQIEVLYDAGLIAPGANFYDHAGIADRIGEDPSRPANVTAALEAVERLSVSDIHAPDSPLWYRGNVGCGALVELDRLLPVLDAIGARRVVIGHTPTLTRQVLSRLDGRVIEIDTGMLNAYYSGSGNALLIDGDHLSVINEQAELSEPRPHPRRVGLRDAGLGAERIEELFAFGRVERLSETDDGDLLVSVHLDEDSVNATFVENPRGRGFVPELAAYRLDRFLELGMVPVTVAREVNGEAGVLQFTPPGVMNEAERSAGRRGSSAWCPLPEQWDAMYVFDALIHNPGRPQEQMTYSQDNWQLMLTGHADSFGNNRGRPAYLRGVPLDVGSRWQERLEALDDDAVSELLGDVLDKRRRRALGQRRDSLLKDAAL